MQRYATEGANKRFRQPTDQTTASKNQTYDGGGRFLHLSSDSDDSVGNLVHATLCVRSNSDSDSDHKKWTKNPLVVRRVKRSDKTKQVEKRFSGTENSPAAKVNRDRYSYHGPDDGKNGSYDFGSKGSSCSRDNGGGGRGVSKYQRLEEMRKRRLNLSVTSDEEYPPQVSQKNRWSASNIRNLPVTSKQVEPNRPPLQVTSHVDLDTPPPRNNPISFGPQSFGSTIHTTTQSSLSSNIFAPKPAAQHITTKTSSPMSNFTTGLALQPTPAVIPDTKPWQSFKTPNYSQQTGLTGSWKPLHLQFQTPGSPQYLGKIGQENPSIFNPLIRNSSTDIALHGFTSKVPVTSIGPARDSLPKTNVNIRDTNQPTTLSRDVRLGQTPQSPTYKPLLVSKISGASLRPNNESDKILEKTKTDNSVSVQKFPRKGLLNIGVYGNGEDSLDELVESNIQYLNSGVDKTKTKKLGGNTVAKFSSLPDHRKMLNRNSEVPTFIKNHPSIQVQANTNIQLHVSLPTDIDTNSIGAPVIQITPSSDNNFSSGYGFKNHAVSHTDVVIPGKFTSNTFSSPSRLSSGYYNDKDMSRSESHVQVFVPSYPETTLKPEAAYAGGYVDERKTRSDTETSLRVPHVDKGMFSDVEYDIEVSERVKKWETFMKVRDLSLAADKKNLITIHENMDTDALVPTGSSNARGSFVLAKQSGAESSNPKSFIQPPARRQFSFDKPVQKSDNENVPNMLTLQSNAQRSLHVVQDPQLNVQHHSVSKFFHAPFSLRPEKTFTSASDLRQKLLDNRLHAHPVTSGPVQAPYRPTIPLEHKLHDSSSPDSVSLVKRPSSLTNVRDAAKRGSKHIDELDEISNIKTESVVNLRRRFDTDSATVTSEEDKKSVSTATAKLTRPPKDSIKQKESTDFSKVIPGYQSKIKESDVWSPNLESTQGVPVSIERVTARTLQTIPFSDDPFWKEIEQMTTFDPSNTEGLQMLGNTKERTQASEPVRSQQFLELLPPQTSSRASQSVSPATSGTERMLKSKLLYTPNITPLSVDVSSRSPSSAVSALDEVLSDINKSSMERKQLSPKKRSVETEATPTNLLSSNIPRFLKTQSEFTRPSPSQRIQFEILDANSHTRSTKPFTTVNQDSKQPPQSNHFPLLYQGQKDRPSQVSQNNYQLDANLLKQKLLSTGLVEEAEPVEPAEIRPYKTSSLERSKQPGNKGDEAVRPSYSTISSHVNNNISSDKLASNTWTQPSHQAKNVSTSSVNIFLPRPMNQTGSRTLDDIQKALAPFNSTSYQPNPETLYGTSKLQSFKEPRFDTSRGSNTSATGWSYHTQFNKQTDQDTTNDSSLSSSSSRLQQVNESMDDLKNLALDVEHRINDIKHKLQTADENSLDSILLSLRKLTPEVKSQGDEPANLNDYYTTKKTKLTDALTELDKIYTHLELNSDHPTNLQKKPVSKAQEPSYIISSLQPKSVHLRPMQTRVSSVFIRGNNKSAPDKESEFDVISKSFQAIVDEVNQTTDLLTRAVERDKQDNVAPETQKQTFKTTVRPGMSDNANAASTKASVTADLVSSSTGSRLIPKKQDSFEKENDIGANNTSLSLASDHVRESNGGDDLKTIINTVKVIASAAVTPPPSSGPPVQQQNRVRPVKDNKIVQDDRAAKSVTSEKTLKTVTTPRQSPLFSRKALPNTRTEGDAEIQMAKTTHGGSLHLVDDTDTNQRQMITENRAQNVEDKNIIKSPQCVAVSSPLTQRKVVSPPYSSKSEIFFTPSPRTTKADSPLPTTDHDKGPMMQKSIVNIFNVLESRTGGLQNPSSSDSLSSTNFTSTSATETFKSKTSSPSVKHSDTEGTPTSTRKTTKRLGTGVAMLLNKFGSSEAKFDGLKKPSAARDEADLAGSESDGDNNEGDNTLNQTQSEDIKDNKTKPVLNSKGSAWSPKRAPIASEKSAAMLPLERKIVDPEAKVATSSQPSSPVNKPPQSPWKRHPSDPEKQAIIDSFKAGSPKFVSKIPRRLSSNGSTASDGYFTPKEIDSPNPDAASPVSALTKTSPPGRRTKTEIIKSRPHSFHELISCFEKDSNNLKTFDKFRKSASAGEVNSDIQDTKESKQPAEVRDICEKRNGKSEAIFKFPS